MHVDPETLALLALGERIDDLGIREHLDSCAECQAELVQLTRAATLGRSTLAAGELLIPDDRVWTRISQELAIDPVDSPAAPVVVLRPRARRGRRWAVVGIAAAAAAVLALGVISWQVLQPVSADVLASAKLNAFPNWKGSSGEARVEKLADGSRVVRVSLSSPEHHQGYDEVWLISSDASQLVSLGVLDDGTGTFTIPAGVNLAHYDLVDISSEPLDGNPAHSTNSIVRGQLS